MTTTNKSGQTALSQALGFVTSRPDIAVLFAALLALFSPTIWGLFNNGDAALWSKGEHSHGPIMATVATWLLVVRWREYFGSPESLEPQRNTWLAWPILMFGMLLYIAGEALGIIYAEVGSFLFFLMGLVLVIGGTSLLNQLKFPIFFYFFMIPLPGFIVDPISQFIKLRISIAVTEILWGLGYPISHTGVILQIGQYQLLVADACAGMRTLFMLEAMGIFYINIAKFSSWFRNLFLALLIIPISFTANMIRVMALALITYHFGDEVGQGFLHGFAGIVLFVSALLLIISIDAGLRALSDRYFQKKVKS
jgi:exosortase B